MTNKTYPLTLKVLTYKSFYKSILFILTSLFSKAQSIQYESFPMPSQLFQRDDFNKAIIPVKGKIYTEGYTDISLLVKRDNKNYSWKKQKLSYQTAEPKNAPFSFETEIKAELSEYSFYVYLFKGSDSLLVKEQNGIICGDVILVYGQSNALASDSIVIAQFNDENQFGRTAYANYDTNEYLWLPTKRWNYWSVGMIGLEIQKQLINKYKIPIAIINGAIGNTSIVALMLRDEKYHNNPTTIYGKLLKKSEGLGFAKKVRAIVWRQGESEALDGNYKNEYPKNFDIFRKQLLEDYPALKKIYTYQNNIYFGGQPNAGNLRDYQRNIKSIYPDCEALATFGTLGFDGLHYNFDGYQQNGEEMSRLIARDFLQSTDILEIDSPNIKKAYFTAQKDSLILEFDKNQKLSFPNEVKSNGISLNLKDYFYLDGKSVNVVKGSSSNNLIILKFNEPQNASKVTYTPDNYTFDIAAFLPGLPPIKNSRGVRAFTFKDFPITNNIETAILTGQWDNVSKKSIVLDWSTLNNSNKTFYLEKAANSANYFTEIASSNGLQFIDYKVKKGVNYFYRLRIIENTTNIMTYSNTIEINIPYDLANTISVSTDAIIVYPNPIQKGKDLNLDVINDAKIKTIRLTDLNSIIVKQILGDLTQYQYSIQTDNLNSGMYIIEAILEDNTKLIKKFVVE
jgi:hypothetical protein